jgi:hypothetical protein
MKLFTEKLLSKISKKKVIARKDNVPYLVRYTFFKWGFLSLKIHHILIDDDHCMHDHPWPYMSVILKGGYFEVTPCHIYTAATRLKFNDETNIQFYPSWSVLFRKARHVHRLQLPYDQTCWTLFFTFRRERLWGFFTKYGWFPESLYNSKNHCD